MEQISYDINSQSAELVAHQLLSVYKMAEVQIVSPEPSRSPVMLCFSLLSLITYTFLTTKLFMYSVNHMTILC